MTWVKSCNMTALIALVVIFLVFETRSGIITLPAVASVATSGILERMKTRLYHWIQTSLNRHDLEHEPLEHVESRQAAHATTICTSVRSTLSIVA